MQSEELLYVEIEKVNQYNPQTDSNFNSPPVRCPTASHLMYVNDFFNSNSTRIQISIIFKILRNKVNDYRKKNRLSKLNLPVFPSIRKRENPSDEAFTSISESISRKSASPMEANFLKSEQINKLVIILRADFSIFMKTLNFIYKKKKRIR